MTIKSVKVFWKPPGISAPHSATGISWPWEHCWPGPFSRQPAPCCLVSENTSFRCPRSVPALEKSIVCAQFELLFLSLLLMHPLQQPELWPQAGGQQLLQGNERCFHVEVETRSRCSQRTSRTVQQLLMNISARPETKGQWNWRKKRK